MRAALVLALTAALAMPAIATTPATQRKLIVIGIDGMDPNLLEGFMADGLTPNLSRLAETGGFVRLGTSTPPQSPVAWSNLITGTDPGEHGIFDFIALDRESMTPKMSTAEVEKSERQPLRIGKWRIPMGGDTTVQLRKGEAFWQVLERNDIPTTLFRMPANYPPLETEGRALSGMGTPDLRGTSGTFTYYTDDPEFEDGRVSGGLIRRVRVDQHRVSAVLEGPPNSFLEKSPSSETEFRVHLDPEHPVAAIEVDGTRVVLNAGEWSGWVPVAFELAPFAPDVAGMVRFYLKETSPRFRLYVSPVNIDPGDAAMPISSPEEYARDLFEAAGPFYTQEMPEDTKALSRHVLTPKEFIDQSDLVLAERRRLLRHELERFEAEQGRGLLFFYFSTIDQRSHMLWRQMDTEHPFHDKTADEAVAHALREVYAELDQIVGEVMAVVDEDTTLIVMSDHGFSPFRYQANLNTWLEQNGYLALKDPEKRDQAEWLMGIDWGRTRAFALGLNSLYLNVQGRERYGIVAPAEREALAREIATKLEEWKHAPGGDSVVTDAAVREDVYHGPYTEIAPDIIVGYGPGYRSSWATTTGKIPAGLIEANDREWSGDHCMDARVVPGVLLANRPLSTEPLELRDLTVTILETFGVEAPAQMRGRSAF